MYKFILLLLIIVGCKSQSKESSFSSLKNNKGIIVIDEQNVNGGLASCVFEACSEFNITKTIKTVCLPNKYIYENGGREYLLNKYGISYKGIIKKYNQGFVNHNHFYNS